MIAAFQNPMFQDESKAREALEAVLWPHGPFCRHCGNADAKRIAKMQGKSARPGLYYCNECKREFTVTVGTIFERSKVPLTKWWMAAHLFNQGKNGVSAHEIHRQLKVSYKTAWFMMHRLREAMSNDKPKTGMGGVGHQVQSDETYYGNTSKRAKHYKKGHSNKSGVIALVNPASGEVRAFAVKTATSAVVNKILKENVHRGTTLVTDESKLYKSHGMARHETVWHAANEYVNKDGYTTNNVENFFGTFKRGMRGTYVFCSEKHLQRYLNEFSFRYTYRSGLGFTDGERTVLAMKGIEGKRLTYRPTN